MGRILTKRAVVAAKIEAVEGVAETLAGADANFFVKNPKFNPDISEFKRENVNTGLSAFPSIPGTQAAEMSFEVELKGSGTLGVAPALGKLIRACGFTESVVGAAGGFNQASVGTTNNPLRGLTNVNQEVAAQFTSSGETITTLRLMIRRLGAIASGTRIWAEIQTDTAGAPSGTPVTGGVSDLLDASIISTVYGLVPFSFPASPVLAAAAHHVVLKGNYVASDTLQIQWRSLTVGSGGNFESKDAGTWSDTATEMLEGTSLSGTGVTYTPVSDLASIPTMTMAVYRDGVLKQMRGCRGKFKYAAKHGEPGMLEFTFQGVYQDFTDLAMVTPSGLETTRPVPLLTAEFSAQGFAAFVSSISFDTNGELQLRPDINTASGWISCLLTGREIKGTFDPEEELIATQDWFGKWKSGATGAMTWKHQAAVPVAGNIVTFTAPAVQYIKIAEADRGGIAILNTDILFARSAGAGDDEMVIQFS